jgi:hypothetical protein
MWIALFCSYSLRVIREFCKKKVAIRIKIAGLSWTRPSDILLNFFEIYKK